MSRAPMEIDLAGLSRVEIDALELVPGDELMFVNGRVRLLQRTPDRLRTAPPGVAEWLISATSSFLTVGRTRTTDIPALGKVLVASELRPRTIEDMIAREKAGLPVPAAEVGKPPFSGDSGPEDEDLEPVIEAALAYIDAARSDNTHRAYATDWRIFKDWCVRRQLEPLPACAKTVALFISDQASCRVPSTISRRLAAIRHVHREAGHPPPQELDDGGTLKDVVAGIARKKGRRPRQAAPLGPAEIRAMVDRIPDDLRGMRDKSLILLGFAGSFRRSEVCALDRRDLVIEKGGMRITLPFSKGDQEGEGLVKTVPRARNPRYCPVTAVEDWLEAAGIAEGPVFRSFGPGTGRKPLPSPMAADSLNRLLKRLALATGLDPARISGHSLRRGWMTAVAPLERPIEMARHAGHKDIRTSLGYIEDAGDYGSHIGKGLL